MTARSHLSRSTRLAALVVIALGITMPTGAQKLPDAKQLAEALR